ncbi:MAG: hypothetical protein V2I43_01850 [Parvularcula sp.]|jgi:hypothetical protein|nr:hypothetical protein [Parvularcula sp.]
MGKLHCLGNHTRLALEVVSAAYCVSAVPLEFRGDFGELFFLNAPRVVRVMR